MVHINTGLPPELAGLTVLIIEVLGAISLAAGYFSRIFSALLAVLFGLFFYDYLSGNYKTLTLFTAALAAIFFGLIFTGSGHYAIAVQLKKR